MATIFSMGEVGGGGALTSSLWQGLKAGCRDYFVDIKNHNGVGNNIGQFFFLFLRLTVTIDSG